MRAYLITPRPHAHIESCIHRAELWDSGRFPKTGHRNSTENPISNNKSDVVVSETTRTQELLVARSFGEGDSEPRIDEKGRHDNSQSCQRVTISFSFSGATEARVGGTGPRSSMWRGAAYFGGVVVKVLPRLWSSYNHANLLLLVFVSLTIAQ